MKNSFLALLCLLLLASFGYKALATDEHVKATLIADTASVVPNKPFRLGVQLTMNPGWHTYYKEPGDAGMATKIIWELPPGFTAGPLLWEKPEKFSDAGITTYGYVNNTLIAAQIIPPQKITSKEIHFSANVEYLACKELCVPGKAKVDLIMNVADQAASNNQDLFAKTNFNGDLSSIQASPSENNLFLYLVFAFVGGILLNFMPCVLPVVAIKILNILEQTDTESARKATIAFAAGIFSSFLLLGFLVIALQAAGHQVGWGFQFQQPIFLKFMSSLVLLFALSLFGLLNFSIVSIAFGQRSVNKLANQQGLVGDFFKGALATILSTPCTAPFLGTALGFAFVQPWLVTLIIFAAVGAGMCLPYIILIIAPGYMRFLPKPGIWMEKLKEALGFILLATTVWLVSILAQQVSFDKLIGWIYFLLILAFAIWLMDRFVNLASSLKRMAIVYLLALLIVATGAYFCVFSLPNSVAPNSANRAANADTEPFNIAALDQALTSGKTVFLDFTARWCLTCQVNEATAINTRAVQDKMHALNVVYMKADWTKQDPTITSLLKKYGRSGVPLYVIFPAKNPNQPIILPELITQQIVLDSLDKAK